MITVYVLFLSADVSLLQFKVISVRLEKPHLGDVFSNVAPETVPMFV